MPPIEGQVADLSSSQTAGLSSGFAASWLRDGVRWRNVPVTRFPLLQMVVRVHLGCRVQHDTQ